MSARPETQRAPAVGERVVIRSGILVGLFAEVERQSKRTAGLTVRLLEGRRAYKVGDHVHVAAYDVSPAPEVMDLWLENKKAAHFTLPMSEIAARFASSRMAQVARESWPLERALRCWLTGDADGGLNSVFEESQYPALHELARRAVFPEDA